MSLELDAAKLAIDLKAENCRLIDVRGITSVTDTLFICSADNERQVEAIANNILNNLPKSALLGTDGFDNCRWIILDYGRVMIHVFHEHERLRYRLDEVFEKGKVIEIPQEYFLSA